MTKLRFHMAGSGGWQKHFPDEQSYTIYEYVYRNPRTIQEITSISCVAEERVNRIIDEWLKVKYVREEDNRIVGHVPIITDPDYKILDPWLRNIAEFTSGTIRKERTNYQRLAEEICKSQDQSTDNVLTILVCACTLDFGTLGRLESGIMGAPPRRGDEDHYFFWGEKTEERRGLSFGVNIYGTGKWHFAFMHSGDVKRTPLSKLDAFRGEMNQIANLLGRLAESPRYARELSAFVSWNSERLDQLVETLIGVRMITAVEPYHLMIPVFGKAIYPRVKELYEKVSERIAKSIEDSLEQLKILIRKCSFSHCSLGDILCMMFHEGYSEAASELMKEGTVPAFPPKAGADWGMWVWHQ